MLQELGLKNFTAFGPVKLEFCDGLNVIVGDNGTGKTHLLKLGYLLSTIRDAQVKTINYFGKESVERYVSERLRNIFKPDRIGNLSRSDADGKSEVTGVVTGSIPAISSGLQKESLSPPMADSIAWQFRFSKRAKTRVVIDRLPERPTANARYGGSVYLPSKEMLAFFEGFLALYDNRELQFDETFRDLALKLSSPGLKEKPRLSSQLLTELGSAIGGEMVMEGGRFYTVSGKNRQRREIPLLAEGLRKLATIMQLIENGSLEAGGTLFWDEPEANMNPRLIRLVVKALIHLSNSGIQVIAATHSLFLLREIEIQLADKQSANSEQKYFSLEMAPAGVLIKQEDSVEDMDPLILLDESLSQSERFMQVG